MSAGRTGARDSLRERTARSKERSIGNMRQIEKKIILDYGRAGEVRGRVSGWSAAGVIGAMVWVLGTGLMHVEPGEFTFGKFERWAMGDLIADWVGHCGVFGVFAGCAARGLRSGPRVGRTANRVAGWAGVGLNGVLGVGWAWEVWKVYCGYF